MRHFLLFSGLIAAIAAHATDYYVSPNGNDAANGTSPATAWQTLDRLQDVQYSLDPGDQILLERGGVYRGMLPMNSSGTAAAPIIAGAYGQGAMPVVSGSVIVSGWEVYQGNIWRAPVAGPVKQVYVEGGRMTLARYPNTGWLRMDMGTATSLEDADLSQPDGYWTGATAVIRASNWNYNLGEVDGFANGTLTFPSTHTVPGNYHWGYFMRNKLSELDTEGEWYYDELSGMLYLQAPGNADPTGLEVEASVRELGASIGWNREYVRIQDLAFRHQTDAGIHTGGGHHITVTGCSFAESYHGLTSYGTYNTYENCTYSNTLASGVVLIDEHTQFTGNVLDSIAIVPGEGESNWGYFGVRVIGSDNTVSDNRLTNIGYTGIEFNNNTVVERNVLYNCLATLNDGGGIAFDNTDGAIVRDNIIMDMGGNLESSAPDFSSFHAISFGIYFGNHEIKNTLVQGNTVAGCGAGIHVDHTMSSTGIAIEDNVLFGNDVQLSLSDWSNNSGPAAVPPYYIPAYNDVYSGNVLYALGSDQLCVRQLNTHSDLPVDFGSFSNNRYFNPYNELSIVVTNYTSGTQRYTLERWQAEHGEDAGSTRSPLRLTGQATVQELSGNLVQNGNFTNNVNGWEGWPTNAEVSHVTDHLDNGALKAYLPDNSMYPTFSMDNPEPFPIENGAWYRVRCTVQGPAEGIVEVGIKELSSSGTPYSMWVRPLPFSPERRDLEMYIQSGLTDQARITFKNDWADPMYYLDNVEVTRVEVQPVDPHERNKLFLNDQATTQSFTLPDGCWKDVDGIYHSTNITLDGFSSKVLVKQQDEGPCDISTGTDNGAAPSTGTAYPNPVRPGGWLHLGSDPEAGSVQLWDLNGRIVLDASPQGTGMVKIPAGLQPGVYAAAVKGENNSTTYFKLVVQ